MEEIKWSDELAIGVPMIDDDHRNLLDLVNLYRDAITAGDRTEVKKNFASLFDYTLEHFAREEAYFATIGYTDLPNHQKKHRELVDRVKEINVRIQQDTTDTNDLANTDQMICDWLIDHISEEDRKMIGFL